MRQILLNSSGGIVLKRVCEKDRCFISQYHEVLCWHVKNRWWCRSYPLIPTKHILRKGDKERGLKESSNLKLKQCNHASFYLALHDCGEIGPLWEYRINNEQIHESLILSCLRPTLEHSPSPLHGRFMCSNSQTVPESPTSWNLQ